MTTYILLFVAFVIGIFFHYWLSYPSVKEKDCQINELLRRNVQLDYHLSVNTAILEGKELLRIYEANSKEIPASPLSAESNETNDYSNYRYSQGKDNHGFDRN